MTGLQPVSFRKGRAREPRLSDPYVPGKHDKRYWTDAENEVVRRYYPKGGADACLPHLPEHRTRGSVHQRATVLGVTSRKEGRQRRRRVEPSAELDQRIRTGWAEMGTGRGAVSQFADQLGVPRSWLSKRAATLGLTAARFKQPRWTAAEDELMRRAPLHQPELAARMFREHGFQRSVTAIVVRAKKLELSRRASRPTLSASQAAKLLGVDSKTLSGWCIAGDIKAERRGTRRRTQQGGDVWDIRREDLRRFVVDQLERIDIRKVDKVAFVDLLTDAGG